jgi:hypothetical protein
VTLEDRIEGLIRERTCTRAEYHALRRYRSFQRRGGAPLPADFYLASACLNGAAQRLARGLAGPTSRLAAALRVLS